MTHPKVRRRPALFRMDDGFTLARVAKRTIAVQGHNTMHHWCLVECDRWGHLVGIGKIIEVFPTLLCRTVLEVDKYLADTGYAVETEI